MYPDTPDSGKNTFPSREKLKHRKSIQFLFKKGSSCSKDPLRVVYLSQPAIPKENVPKFSVTVSKKNFAKAVHRNKLKRWIREAYRLNKGPMLHFCEEQNISLHMMWIYTSKELKIYHDIKQVVPSLIHKILTKISGNHPKNLSKSD